MRSSSSYDEEAGLQRRRNARSLDMGSSREASKAAAWMWHMRSSSTSKKDREEKQPDYAIWPESKRRSASCDRKDSRFRQEATALASTSVSATTLKPVASPPSCKAREASIWDCGSKLYDTFELVSFSNRLDRSLLGVPAYETPNFRHVAPSPLQHHSTFAGVLRTFSLPRTLSVQKSRATAPRPINDDAKPSSHDHDVINNDANSASDTRHAPLSDLQDTFSPGGAIKPKFSAVRRVLTTKWSFSKLARVLKKVVKFRKQMQCFRPSAIKSRMSDKIELMGDKEGDGGMSENLCASRDKNVANELVGDEDEVDNGISEHRYRVYEEKVNEGKVGKHFHHHHHHFHHHFVHQLDQFSQPFKEEDACKLQMSADRMGADAAWPPPVRAESARLSSDTLSKICADVNWL